jgi:formate-dependent nitrite reductase cytochrome c552 subunit
MRRIGFILPLIGLLLLLGSAGCEREITGNIEETDTSSSSCFDCHSDTDQALTVARIQYENSAHEAGANVNRNHLYQPFYGGCEKCHTNEGFLANLAGGSAGDVSFTAISCFTCHAPHSTGSLELRVETDVTLADGSAFTLGNARLCASCHQSRRNVNTYVTDNLELSTHYGPHYSCQSDMLLATNAYEYTGYDYSSSYHEDVPGGCVDCHMSTSLHESVGGHSWNMRNEARGFENTFGCNVDGCHRGNLDSLNRVAFVDFDGDGDTLGVQDEIHGLSDSLRTLLVDAGLLEYNTTDSAYEPVDGRVVATADSVGALYNWLFVYEDQSYGIHNTDYAVDLLVSSINFLNTGSPNGVARPHGEVARLMTTH